VGSTSSVAAVEFDAIEDVVLLGDRILDGRTAHRADMDVLSVTREPAANECAISGIGIENGLAAFWASGDALLSSARWVMKRTVGMRRAAISIDDITSERAASWSDGS